MNKDITPASAGGKNPRDKSRPGIIDSSGSEATRELRDTARRRRDSEEKLQQHLQESKEHAEEKKHLEESADVPDPEGKTP
ncbi:hypothetical protein [Pseudarthrobacter sp. N5]|uniref:hypothetical protein n=1 Tax=Pseudarthrobacter sp. N5 TaxID=3418416 RepID=UPI003CF1975C